MSAPQVQPEPPSQAQLPPLTDDQVARVVALLSMVPQPGSGKAARP